MSRPKKRVAILTNDTYECGLVSFVLSTRCRYRIEVFEEQSQVSAFIEDNRTQSEPADRVNLVIGVQCSFNKDRAANLCDDLLRLKGSFPAVPVMLIDAGYGTAPDVDLPRVNVGPRDLKKAIALAGELTSRAAYLLKSEAA